MVVLFGSSSQDMSFMISCFQVEQEHRGCRDLLDHPQSFVIVWPTLFGCSLEDNLPLLSIAKAYQVCFQRELFFVAFIFLSLVVVFLYVI